jgi:Domain of unknown function (DUF4145)
MKVDEKNTERLRALVEEIDTLSNTVYHGEADYESFIDPVAAYDWGYKALNTLENIFGENGKFFLDFKEDFIQFGSLDNLQQISISEVWKVFGIVKAAYSEYKNGYVYKLKTLVQAEMFDDLLEQAEELLQNNYFLASAVIAGSVLEDALRKLCIKNKITLSAKPKMDSMNVELAKANVYNLLKQKQITALADLRNKAAHNQGGFTKEDVEDMIRSVRRFMEDYFS